MIKHGARILFVLLFLFNIGLAGYYINHKEGFFMDELWSYGHANSSQGAFLSQDIDSHFTHYKTGLHEHWINGKVFHDYLTTQKDEQFSYGHIIKNLQKSVHPPLFYYLLHTVCSFMPDKFSPWQAGAINLFFFMLTLLVFYKFSRLFIKDEYLAMAPVFLWGFSNIGLATCVFLRMYAMQTFFAVCLIYEVSKMLLENEADNKRLFLIFLWATLGNLTQFSSLVFAFFTALLADIVLCRRKNLNAFISFSVVMLFSVGVLFAVYPEAYDVLRYSKRGVESYQYWHFIFTQPLSQSMAFLGRKNIIAFGLYFSELFNIQTLGAMLITGVFFLLMLLFVFKKINSVFFVPFFVFILTTIYLAICMTYDLGMTSRYHMMLMPIAALIIVYLFSLLLTQFKVPTKVMTTLVAGFVLCLTLSTDFKTNMYRIPINEETRVYLPKLAGKNILIVSDIPAFFENALMFSKAKAVYFAKPPVIGKDVLKKADYMLITNNVAWDYVPLGKNKVCFMCAPAPKPLDEDFAKQLKFKAPYRSGVVNFDLYEVKH